METTGTIGLMFGLYMDEMLGQWKIEWMLL